MKNRNRCRPDQETAQTFPNYLSNVLQPFTFNTVAEQEEVMHFLESACQMDLSIKHISPSEVKQWNYKTEYHKDSRILQNKWWSVLFLTTIFNSIIRLNHFPIQWNCEKIIMIQKQGKPETDVASYRPTSLSTIFAKTFE